MSLLTAKELKERISNNDNRMTASPYLLLIQEKRYMYSSDGDRGGERVFILDEDEPKEFKSIKEMKEYFKEAYHGTSKRFSYKELYKREYFETVNVCLTDKGYEDHLVMNRHNLSEPRTFGIHAWRNNEIKSLLALVDSHISLEEENEKLKKALEKAKEYLFYIAKAEKHCDQEIEKCYCERNSAQIALKEIEEMEKGK